MLKDFIDYTKERIDSANPEGKTKKPEVPIWERYTLTVEEAADDYQIDRNMVDCLKGKEYMTQGYGVRVNRDCASTNSEKEKTRRHDNGVPVWCKTLLSLEEASDYSGLGIHKLRDISNADDCKFVLWNGTKRMFKRKLLDEYLESVFSI